MNPRVIPNGQAASAPSSTSRSSTSSSDFDGELRARIRELNAQIDDVSSTLLIPRAELYLCVNRLLAAVQQRAR